MILQPVASSFKQFFTHSAICRAGFLILVTLEEVVKLLRGPVFRFMRVQSSSLIITGDN